MFSLKKMTLSFPHMKTNGVSIIIPYYNASKTIKRTLDSCSEITFQSIEIVLVNDGSTELKTSTFLEALLSEYSFDYQFIDSKTNNGLPFTRNMGIKASKYDFVVFLDADDEIAPQRFNHLEPLFKNESDILFMDFIEIYPDGKRIYKSRKDFILFEDLTAFFLHYAAVSVIFTYRKLFLEEIGYFRRIPAEDKDLIFRLTLTNARFKYIPINSYFYYQAIPESRTNRGNAFLLESVRKPFFLFAFKELERQNRLTTKKIQIISQKLIGESNAFIASGFFKLGVTRFYQSLRVMRTTEFGRFGIWKLVQFILISSIRFLKATLRSSLKSYIK